jgi:hypothetical protein
VYGCPVIAYELYMSQNAIHEYAAQPACRTIQPFLQQSYLVVMAASRLLGPKISAEAMLNAWSFPKSCSTTYSEAS